MDRPLEETVITPGAFCCLNLGAGIIRLHNAHKTCGEGEICFTQEAARDGSYHEFQFWLAVANYRLGDMAQARRHLDRALAASTTRSDHELYAAKLDWIRAQQQP